MRVVTLENSGRMYTSQVYLVLGDASQLEDVNTLVDVGQDPAILASIDKAPTGVGKWPVEQVVLTHSHSDHCALLPQVRAVFHPRVLGLFSEPRWRRWPAARWGHHPHGRRGVRGDPRPRSQQRLDLPVQRVGRRALRRRLAAADHLAGEQLRGRVSGGIGETVRPRCKANLLRARASVDRALQPEAARVATTGRRKRAGQRNAATDKNQTPVAAK